MKPSLAIRWVRFAAAHRTAVLLGCAAIAAAGALGTFQLYADLRPDMEELLPRNARSAHDLDEVSARVGGWGEDAVILSGADRATIERFADDLNALLQKEPREVIKWTEYRINDLAAFYKDRRWLIPDVDKLVAVRDRLKARIRWEKQRANPLFVPLDGDDPAPTLDDLPKLLGAGQSDLDRFPDGYYVGEVAGLPTGAPGGRSATASPARGGGEVPLLIGVMLVRMGGAPDDYRAVKAVHETVLRLVAQLGPHRYSPTFHVAYGGYIATDILEHDALSEDLAIATSLVMLAVALAIALYYRTWKAIPAIGVPLLAGTLATFGVAELAVGHLNSNTAFLGSIVVGNGINVGLILFARYLEERRRGVAPLAAMELAVDRTWRATFIAAFAAGISYASLMTTAFRGFNQFGLIGGVGMALCWLFTYAMVPPLALAWEARSPLVKAGERPSRPVVTELVARLVHNRPRAVLAVAALLSVASVAFIARYAKDPIEMNLGKLADRRTLRFDGPGWWEDRLVSLYGEHFTPNVFACKSPEEARAVTRILRAERDANPDTTFGSITSIERFVPDRQEEKLAVLAEIRALATPEALALLGKEQRAQADKLLPPANLTAFTANDLPAWLRARLTETNGTVGTMVLVYANSKFDVRGGRDMLRFEQELRAIKLPSEDIPVASPLLLFADMLHAIGKDGPRATLLSLLGVVLLVLFMFGAGNGIASDGRSEPEGGGEPGFARSPAGERSPAVSERSPAVSDGRSEPGGGGEPGFARSPAGERSPAVDRREPGFARAPAGERSPGARRVSDGRSEPGGGGEPGFARAPAGERSPAADRREPGFARAPAGERSPALTDAAKVIASLGVGVLWFAGLAGAIDEKLNLLNFIALPITFGIGVDYATNIYQRKRLEPASDIADCLRTTGGAVALCSLTTIIGYSSLLVAHNQALNSFGMLADLGELACLAAALLALPAFLRVRELAREPAEVLLREAS